MFVHRITSSASLASEGPLHRPRLMLNVVATAACAAETIGSAFHRGATGSTTAEGAEPAGVEPSPLVAVTTITSRCPMSAAIGVYRLVVAPGMLWHPVASGAQRCQTVLYVVSGVAS